MPQQRKPTEHVLTGRMSHMCAIIGPSMFMLGGYRKVENEARFKDRDQTVDMADINIYSPVAGTWRQVKATGCVPNRGSGMCMAVNRHFIYVFGGLTVNPTNMREFSNTLHELNTETLTWRLLSPSDHKLPSIRDKSAMVYYDGGVWVFAGWGTRIDRTQHNSTFVPDTSHDFVGWNNELWRFDLATMKWSAPCCTGNIPSPRAAHTLTMCAPHRAVLFGGRTREGRVSELYVLDLKSLVWEGPVEAGPGPEARSLHTCTRLHDDNVLLLGGMNSVGDSVEAQWLLNTRPPLRWHQVKLCSEDQCSRTWHATTCQQVSESCSELLVFGGSPDNIWQPKHKYWANLTRFFYGVRPLYDLCVDHLSGSSSHPTHDMLAEDVRQRQAVLKDAASLDRESVLILEMQKIKPNSAS